MPTEPASTPDPRLRPGPPVVPRQQVDEGDAQPARRGVERHARPGDAAADHDDIEGLVAEPSQGGLTVEEGHTEILAPQ